MATDELRGAGTYRRYKLGQVQFTNWLKQTADRLAPRKSSDPPSQQQKKQSAANAAASSFFGAGPQRNSVPESTKPFIHWKQLEVLAQTVVDNANPAEIPPAAINILRDVVTLRKQMSRCFSAQAKKAKDEKIQKDNLGHLHIINVLENVLAKLESFVPWAGPSSKAKNKQPRKETDMLKVSDLTNMFTHLKVQKGDDTGSGPESQSDEERPASKRPQKQSKRKGAAKKPSKGKKPEKHGKALAKPQTPWIDDVEFDLTPMETDDYDDEFDYYMMVYCFFVDFNNIRNYVAERWCDYWYDRSVSLTTLAVVTNAAFESFNRMEGELIENLGPHRRELSRYEDMMQLLFIDFGIEHVDYDSYEGLSTTEEQERIWREESDWLAFSSYCAIRFALKKIPPGKVPMLPPSARSEIIYGANDMEAWRKFSDSVTMQLVTEVAHLKALKKNEQEPPILPAEPEILLAFQNALQSRKYTSALIFSVHLWVDIRFIMEKEVSHSFEELQKTATELQPILFTHAPGKDCRDYRFREEIRGRITELHSYMLNDCQYEDAKLRLTQLRIDQDPEKFFLLKTEPVWAGLMNFRLQLVRSEVGHQFTAQTSIVEAAGYLYLACRAADETLPAWEEMDRYIATYTEQSQFMSNLRSCDNKPETIIRSFEKIMYAHQPAVKEWEDWQSTEGTFVPDVRIRRAYYRRYAWETPGERCSMRYVMELIVHKLRIEREELKEVWREEACKRAKGAPQRDIESGSSKNGSHDGSGAVVRQTTTIEASSSREAELAKERDFRRRAMLAQLSHVEMLQFLEETVTSLHEGLFKLDYFKLYDESVVFLNAVVDAFGGGLKNRVGYDECDDKTTCKLGKVPVHLVKNLDEEAQSGKVLDTLIRVFKQALEEIFPHIPEEMRKKLDSGNVPRVVQVDLATGKEVKELD